MKTFEEQNNELIDFDKEFNKENFNHCVHRAMLLIKNREAQMIESEYVFPILLDTCKWAIQQTIINRDSNKSMMSAAIEYVDLVDLMVDEFNRT